MDLTISIVTFNSIAHIETCLESLFRYPPKRTFEVYVIDNNSSDETVKIVRERFPEVTIIEKNANIGFGAAHNEVLEISESRYCLVLNPDIVVSENAIESMAGFLDNHHEAGALGCKLVNSDGSLQYSCRRNPTLSALLMRGSGLDRYFPNNRTVREYLMVEADHELTQEVAWVQGSCLMLRSATLSKLGYFDERFFMYMEDIDLCYRINASNNWRVFYFPLAQMIHGYQRQTRNFWALKARLNFARSIIHFFHKDWNRLAGRGGENIEAIK